MVRVSSWGRRLEPPGDGKEIAILNEECLRGHQMILDRDQRALYFHVDDGVAMAGGGDAAVTAEKDLEFYAAALEDVGFGVVTRTAPVDVVKVVGYKPVGTPARLILPADKAVDLRSSLLWWSHELWADRLALGSRAGCASSRAAEWRRWGVPLLHLGA